MSAAADMGRAVEKRADPQVGSEISTTIGQLSVQTLRL